MDSQWGLPDHYAREILPEDFISQWSDFRKGVRLALVKSRDHLSPGDILDAVVCGNAKVMAVYDTSKRLATMVLQPNGTYLHVWICFGRVTEEVLAATITYAKECGFEGLTFDSRRKGWNKKALALGFRPRMWSMEF